MADSDPAVERIVPVVILGQRYPVRTALEPGYVTALAAYVDEKMQAAAEVMPSGDPVRLAVLAALNIADELFRIREDEHLESNHLAERTVAVERLLDQVLGRLSPAFEEGPAGFCESSEEP